MGYFLSRAGRDYVIFERNETAGKFLVCIASSYCLSYNKFH